MQCSLETVSSRFPLCNKYELAWMLANEMGPNVLWLLEDLTTVMDLRPGMRVVSLLARRLVPVRWVGWRRIDCTRQPRAEEVWPVRVSAGAFGPGVPHRGLWVSRDHAVFLEGLLIPVRTLINGASIAQVRCDAVAYFHVELAEHGVLLAEGLPAESYLDTGNRSAFANGGVALPQYRVEPGAARQRTG